MLGAGSKLGSGGYENGNWKCSHEAMGSGGLQAQVRSADRLATRGLIRKGGSTMKKRQAKKRSAVLMRFRISKHIFFRVKANNCRPNLQERVLRQLIKSARTKHKWRNEELANPTSVENRTGTASLHRQQPSR